MKLNNFLYCILFTIIISGYSPVRSQGNQYFTTIDPTAYMDQRFEVMLDYTHKWGTYDTTATLDYIKSHADYFYGFNYKPMKIANINDNLLSIMDETVTITFSKGLFNPADHQFTKSELHDYYTEIDAMGFFGPDGMIPVEEIKSFSISVDDEIINIPKTAYQNLFEPNFKCFSEGKRYCPLTAYHPSESILLISMFGSGGAGAYRAIFIIDLVEGTVTRIVERLSP